MITAKVDGRRGKENGHDVIMKGRIQTGREPKVGEGRSREGEDRRKEGGKSDNNKMRKGFSEDVLKGEQALAR